MSGSPAPAPSLPLAALARTVPPQETALHAALAERVAAGKLELPILPHAAAQVLALCGQEDCDARQLADTLNRDPALAGHVLRVANSAAYTPREPIVSLQQAVSRLGFSTLSQIALAVALRSRVFHVGGHEKLVRELWQHSALAGAWAREIARARRSNVEGAFLCGLLHDVGRPVVLQAALDVAGELALTWSEPGIAAAMDEFHARGGALLVATWKMPSWMEAAVLWHHEPERAGEHADEARTTAFADLLAHDALAREPRTAVDWTALPLVAELGLYEEDVEALLAKGARVLELAGSLA